MIDDTMHRLWLARIELESAAHKLEVAGEHVAAEAIAAEASALGDRLLKIERVREAYADAIQRVQEGDE